MKLLGYRYSIHEMYPVEDGDGISKALLTFDKITGCQAVLNEIKRHNYNFVTYTIMVTPVYSRMQKEETSEPT